MNKLFLLLLTVLSFSIFGQDQEIDDSQKYEHILNYHSDIRIQKDCKVLITETITVYAEGNEIRRGIFRELPTSYLYKGGNTHIGFKLLGVKRDGRSEDYHTENFSNGIRIYAGSPSVYIPTGVHTYEFRYEVNHVLGFFDNYDEIYWNVNGTGWEFYIDSISADVYFPEGAKLVQSFAYTGKYGMQGKSYTTEKFEGGVRFAGDRRLLGHENLTVSVAWNKDQLIYPTAWEEFIFWIQSYILWVISGLGILIGFLFNFRMWSKYGRDPKPGTIIPLFYPPADFSPAECIYLKREGRKSTSMFGSMLVGLAVKGLIKIDVSGNKGILSKRTYTVNNLNVSPDDSKKPLTSVEKYFYERLMGSRSTVSIQNGTYNPHVADTNKKLLAKVDQLQKDKFFIRNSHLKGRQFIIPVIAAIIGGICFNVYGGSLPVLIAGVVLMLVMNFIFSRLYEQPTVEGRKKMDEIAGFEMYMKYADKERIRLTNPPTMNFQHYEENLAYAIALGVAKEWAGQFDPIELEESFAHHMPYMTGMMLADFSSIGSDLSHTISSASIPPSSSGSGSGGGGFSGGGGGGGGGGGW